MKTSLIALFILCILQFTNAQELSRGGIKHCLFIGDSYFSHNDLSKHVSELWNEEFSDSLVVANHNRNGATLVFQWKFDFDELSRLLAAQTWHYVIIQLPSLIRPQDSSLIQILHEVDDILINSRIVLVTMDFCNNFPEMSCRRDPIEGVLCNEYLDCKEKLAHVRSITDNLISQMFKNTIQIIPFAHYKHYLSEKLAIELGSDDEYGHPSHFSQSILARFLLFHLKNPTVQVNDNLRLNSKAQPISSFYKTFYNEKH